MIKKMRNNEGFTLIELMIVIAIIGVLAAIAIPNFISYRNKSYCTQVNGDAQAVKGAIGAYFSNPSREAIADGAKPSEIDPNLSLAGSSDDDSYINQTDDAIQIVLKVNADSKCNIGSYFTSYLGTSLPGGWSVEPPTELP